jgi:hypothetical protein
MKTRIIFSLKMTNRLSGKKMEAHFRSPQSQKIYIEAVHKYANVWECNYDICVGNRIKEMSASGANWLQSLLLAVEGVSRKIPAKNEQDWITEEGVPSWIILPKLVPISWGHQLYRELADLTDAKVAKFVAKIDKGQHNQQAKVKRLKKP